MSAKELIWIAQWFDILMVNIRAIRNNTWYSKTEFQYDYASIAQD